MSRPVSTQLRRLGWLPAGITLLGALLFSVPWSWFDPLENLFLDLRYRARGTQPESSAVIIGIADSSFTLAERAPAEVARDPMLAQMTESWPWNRRIFSTLVRRLRASGARAIVFDIVFAAETAGDAEFAQALAEPGAPVVLASLIQENHSAIGEGTVTLVEPRESFLSSNGGLVGYANVWPDRDGVLRRLSTTTQAAALLGDDLAANGTSLPSLALAAAHALKPTAAPAPIAGYIDFSGPTGTIPTLPIEDVFLPDRWHGPWIKSGQLFRDRIVWVGPLSEIRFKDYHATPLGRQAGVEAQAQALNTILIGLPLQPFSGRATAACVWGLAIIGVLGTCACRRVSLQIALVAGGTLVWGALAFGLFSTSGIVLPVVAPLGAWLVATGGGVGIRFIAEQRERRRLRSMLACYVSEEVAKVIADQPEEFSQSMRGGRRAVTVLFADLRGFTTWVETAEPEAFVAQLNEYFHAIVDCVLAQGGTLQKFIGDAVLAVWGDTRSAGPATDTARALDAALAMQAAVERLNLTWAGRTDRTPMTIGIGLHHGQAMVGNVGHPRRMEFTVLGDVVNVASRLESANRQLDTTVLISETVRDLTVSTHRCAPLGRILLKGKQESVGVFTPIGSSIDAPPPWLVRAEAAHAAWVSGDFQTAAATYEELATQATPLSLFFRQQAALSRQHIANPPATWQGERRLDTK